MGNYFLTILTSFALLAACTHKSTEPGHEHGPEPLAYTVYSENLELFVEFQPLILGVTSNFATHLTQLGETFLPLSEGSVTVSLLVGNKGIKQTITQPTKPGIYRLSLQPTVAGTGTLIFDVVTKGFTNQIRIDSVPVYVSEQLAMDASTHETDANEITYLKEQAWNVEFANQVITKSTFNNMIKTSGQILPAPGDEQLVVAKAKGIVLFTGNHTILGSKVSAASPLFSITGGDLTEGNIDSHYKEAKANYEKAKTDFDRASELVKDKIVSQKEFQQTKLDFENARIVFNSHAKNYSGKGQTVFAGSQGFIKNIFVTEGQFVEAGTPLASISKNRKLILQANVSQKYFQLLSSITAANFKTTESDIVFNTNQLNGKLISYGKSAPANSPFIPIAFEIENVSNLIPGSIAEVYLKSSPIPNALLIPRSALIEEQGNYFVYVQTGGERFQKRELKLGATDGQLVQVLSGIEPGERVVINGAYQIKLAASSSTLPAHGHEH